MQRINQDNLDEKFLASKVGFTGKLLTVRVDTVLLPNGVAATREVIHHPGAVCILPVLDNGDIIFVKQFRYPVQSVMYELPAGKLDAGEKPEQCAARELSEETGFRAGTLEKLTSIVTTPGFTDEVIHLYVASELTKFQQHTDADEFIEIVTLTPAQVERMLWTEEIFDAKTLSALYLYLLKRKKSK
ncbi:MAG: NUDIX hydrolase [Acidaminococcaceae bacterium]